MNKYHAQQRFLTLDQFPKRLPIPIPSLDHIDKDLLTYWSTRVYLASMNWRTEAEFKIVQDGSQLSLGLWATHDNWYGTLSHVKKANICCMAKNELAELGLDTWFDTGDHEIDERKYEYVHDALTSQSKRVLEGVFESLQHVDMVPNYGFVDGIPRPCIVQQKYYVDYPSMDVVKYERAYGTNALPGWPGFPDAEIYFKNESRYDKRLMDRVRAYFKLAEKNLHITEHLNYFTPASDWVYTNRRWKLDIRLSPYIKNPHYDRELTRSEFDALGKRYYIETMDVHYSIDDLSTVAYVAMAKTISDIYNDTMTEGVIPFAFIGQIP